MPRKILLLDGHSLAYRAFYGLPLYDQSGRPRFSTSTGEFTNAVYGFASMMFKVWNDEKPDYIATAFDKGRTFRDDKFADYKATRAKMPDELSPQIERIMQLVTAFGIPAITADGYEADDILGTLAKRAARDDIEAIIVTGDSDAFQLIEPKIKVFTSGRLYQETVLYDEALIKERFSLTPLQLIDFKALKGDTSDNVPGVKGIGEKGATQLLQQYGSVENIYAHLADVTPARAKSALEANRDMAFLSKDLVTIRTNVPLHVTWPDCAVHAYDRSQVEALFDELEFKSLRNRLPAGGEVKGEPAAPAKTQQLSMFGATDTARKTSEKRAVVDRPSISKPIVIDDDRTLKTLVGELKKAGFIAFDTETTGTDPLLAELVGISLSVREGEGYYIPVGHAEGRQLPREKIVQALNQFSSETRQVGHNAKYDMAVLHQAGIEVHGLKYDTMLGAFLIEPGAAIGLKKLAKSQLSIEMIEIDELIGTGKKQITMAQVPIADAAAYAAADADVTLRLMHVQRPKLDELGLQKLLNAVDMPLVPVLLDMELAGVKINAAFLNEMSQRFDVRLKEIEAQVYQLVGFEFNLNSPAKRALFGKTGESPGERKTSTASLGCADVLNRCEGCIL
jgi:DNA polymerase-1